MADYKLFLLIPGLALLLYLSFLLLGFLLKSRNINAQEIKKRKY